MHLGLLLPLEPVRLLVPPALLECGLLLPLPLLLEFLLLPPFDFFLAPELLLLGQSDLEFRLLPVPLLLELPGFFLPPQLVLQQFLLGRVLYLGHYLPGLLLDYFLAPLLDHIDLDVDLNVAFLDSPLSLGSLLGFY